MNPHRIKTQQSYASALNRIADLSAILLALAWVVFVLGDEYLRERVAVAAAASILAFVVVSEFTGLYRSWRVVGFTRELFCGLGTWCVTVILLMTLGTILNVNPGFGRATFLVWILSAAALLGISRGATRAVKALLQAQGYCNRQFAIVGVTDLGVYLAKSMNESPLMGLRLAGFYDDRPEERTTQLAKEVGSRVGSIADLIRDARDGTVNIIYITFPMRAEDRIRDVLNRLSDSTASVYVVPDFFVFELLHSRWTNIQGIPAVSIFENPLYGVDGVLKRALDLSLGLMVLAMLAVPMLVVALLIKLTSRGPVFFRQRRYGLDGREILVWKFRSMRVAEDGDHVVQATRNDARVTPVGAILRQTSIDELPQLFNVVAGQMSLVGPRPHATAHNEEYRGQIPGYMLRHKIKPGITGLAQVNGWRGETDTLEKMEKRIECDHQYIRDWNIWMDLRILVRTLGVVFSAKNAY